MRSSLIHRRPEGPRLGDIGSAYCFPFSVDVFFFPSSDIRDGPANRKEGPSGRMVVQYGGGLGSLAVMSMSMSPRQGRKWGLLDRGLGSELAADMGSFLEEPLQKSRRIVLRRKNVPAKP